MPARICEIMADHHAACDTLFAAVESDAAAGRWDAARQRAAELSEAIEWHFGAEEAKLFPAIEQTLGSGGPVEVMRYEHEQIRDLLGALMASLDASDTADLRDRSETLLIVIQQHNAKEENVLYPMCEQFLADRAESVAIELQAEVADACRR